jgi:hypothetical protein
VLPISVPGRRYLGGDEPAVVAAAVVAAIHSGDVSGLRQLLTDHPLVASAPLGGKYKTPLRLVTDWPGYFPNGPEVVRLLVEAGADPDAPNRAMGFLCTGRPAATTPVWPQP